MRYYCTIIGTILMVLAICLPKQGIAYWACCILSTQWFIASAIIGAVREQRGDA